MGYDKKHQEDLEDAKGWLAIAKENNNTIAIQILEKFFPELKESEDEKISKEIIQFLQLPHPQFVGKRNHEEWIAWLEKRGYDDKKWIYEDEYIKDKKQTFQDGMDEVLGNPQKYGLEKQCEQNTIVNESPSKEMILAIWELGNIWKELTKGSSCTEHGTQLQYIQKHWNESDYYEKLQGVQKPVDKVESKFKVGDWVVKDDGSKFTNGSKSVQVTDIDDKGHIWLTSGTWLDEEDIRLWTIQDAKDGDVLHSHRMNLTWIHKDETTYHIAMIPYYPQHISTNHAITIPSDTCPATQEQRDIFFSKMKALGYEWDAEKKELKKIEQNPVEDSCKNSDDITTEEKDRTEYKKGFECGKQRVLKYPEEFGLCKKTNEWGEKDEKMLNSIIEEIRPFGECPDYPTDEDREYYYGRTKMIDWLKSLKFRLKPSEVKNETKNKCPNYSEGYGCSTSPLKQCDTCPDYKLYNHWRPSKEQLKTLWNAIVYVDGCDSNFRGGHMLELLYNELKQL